MPSRERFKTSHPGVFYIQGRSPYGKPEKIFYICYRKNDKQVEEKAGRQYRDDMTPARAAHLRASRINGEPSNQERRTVKRAKAEAERNRWTIERLWEAYKEANPQLKGLVTDENRFRRHIMPAFGHKGLHEIAPLDVDRLRINLLRPGEDKPRSPKTAANVLELLRRINNFAAKRRLCPGLGFPVQLPKVNNLKTEDLSPEELARLLEVLDATPYQLAANLMRLVLLTGMRRGELFRLRWEHIDLRRGFITLVDPKGGQNQRIPLSPPARALLESIPRDDSPYVFPGRGGKQRSDIKRHVNHIKEEAELAKDFRPLHGLRHVFASLAASSGQVDMYTLQKLLTHKSPTMTQRYAHLRDETLQRAAGTIGKIVEEAGVRPNGTEDQPVSART